VTLKCEIKQAIANQEFKLYYQPIINLETNAIAGQEALIRWHHPID
jgi:sensor c-di-GMP phosphodiesterase-like protein